tara:strand:+ start:2389 stop:3225 length:837 start_codon:yes stop_codon:yes gene_type:complete
MPIRLVNTGSTANTMTGSFSSSVISVNSSSDETSVSQIYEAISTSSDHVSHIQEHLNHSTDNTHQFSLPLQYVHAKTLELEQKVSKIYTHTTYNMGHDDIHLHHRDMYTKNPYTYFPPVQMLVNAHWSSSISASSQYGKGVGFAIPWKTEASIDFRLPYMASLQVRPTVFTKQYNPLLSIGGTKQGISNVEWRLSAIPRQWDESGITMISQGVGPNAGTCITNSAVEAQNLRYQRSYPNIQKAGGRTNHYYQLTITNPSPDNSTIYFKGAQIPINLEL